MRPCSWQALWVLCLTGFWMLLWVRQRQMCTCLPCSWLTSTMLRACYGCLRTSLSSRLTCTPSQ